MAEIIEAFHKKFPLVNYDIFTANADSVKEQMEKGLIDVGILLEPIDMEKFNFVRFEKKERWGILMRADDFLAKKDAVSAEDLKNLPLILPSRANVQNEFLNWMGDSFQNSKVLFTSNLSTNGAIMVQKGLGYSIIIEGAEPFLDKEKIVFRPLNPELTANSALAWKKQQSFGFATEKFIEFIKSFF